MVRLFQYINVYKLMKLSYHAFHVRQDINTATILFFQRFSLSFTRLDSVCARQINLSLLILCETCYTPLVTHSQTSWTHSVRAETILSWPSYHRSTVSILANLDLSNVHCSYLAPSHLFRPALRASGTSIFGLEHLKRWCHRFMLFCFVFVNITLTDPQPPGQVL